MYPQCMLFDTVGVLLNDFINQTLGSTFESICCDVQFGDLSRMPWGKDLLEGGRDRVEGMGRGSQPIAIPWRENLTEGGMEGEAQNPRSQKCIRNPIVSNPQSYSIYPNAIRNACGTEV